MKPRNKNGGSIKFPFIFQKNGRTGRIKKWGNDKFGTYFVFGGKKYRNSFRTFEKAFEYLDREFLKLDTEKENALSLHPLNNPVQHYSELEQLVRREADGASLREAVTFFLAYRKTKISVTA